MAVVMVIMEIKRSVHDYGKPYLPERDYLLNEYKPFGRNEQHFCDQCKDYYCQLKELGITNKKFPPKCNGDLSVLAETVMKDVDVESKEAALYLDPITFAYMEFNWKPRWYQLEMLRCSSPKKIVRAGRRCLAKDTLIATTNGPVKIQDIKVGDTVFDENGNQIKVKDVFYNGSKEVVDLRNNGSLYATCTQDHVWLTKYRSSISERKTEDLYKGVQIVRKEIPFNKDGVKNKQAYLLGALIGDGCCRQKGLCISSADYSVIKKIEGIVGYKSTQPKSGYTWYLPEKIKKDIKHYEWIDNKYAHEKTLDINVIKTWDKESILEFIAGIVDTDGSVYTKNGEITLSIGLQAKKVIDVLKYLFLYIWQVDPNIYIDNRTKYKNGPVYLIRIKHIHHVKRILKDLSPYLAVERKKYKEEYDTLTPNNFSPDAVGVSISNSRLEETYDIHVDSDTNLYLLANGLVTHNCGKSEAMAIKILHMLYTNRAIEILLICPYQSQVNRVFQIMRKLAYDSSTFKDSIVKDNTSAPQVMVLANGSKVTGFSSGAKSGGKSTQIRGQDAHAIFIDEMDYLNEEDFEAVLAILASHPDCILWASSTPTGLRKQFFDWCTTKDLGFKEFHFISSESPSWTEEVEELFKNQYSEAGYAREFNAEFGEEAFGVFKNSDINRSIKQYSYEDCRWDPDKKYIIGVDWNENAGTHIIVMQCAFKENTVEYKPVEKIIIEKQRFTQHSAVEEIIRLTNKWRAEYVYCDDGYGHTQIEMLHKYGKDNPFSKMDKKVKGIALGSNIEIKDPLSNDTIKKAAKPFMVNIACRQLESNRCILPRSEDTHVVMEEDGAGGAHVGLIQQMRNFRIERIGKGGSPTYSQGCDHTLTAWMLAILGFFMEFGDINKRITSTRVATSGNFGEKDPPPEVKNKQSVELRKKFIPAPRGLGYNERKVFKNNNALSEIEWYRDQRKAELEERRKTLRIKKPRPGGRNTF